MEKAFISVSLNAVSHNAKCNCKSDSQRTPPEPSAENTSSKDLKQILQVFLQVPNQCMGDQDSLFSLRCHSCFTWQTGWSSGCGGEGWTPITSPFRTWRRWGTCWGPASWPSASTSCGWSGTGTQTWATEALWLSHLHVPPLLPTGAPVSALLYAAKKKRNEICLYVDIVISCCWLEGPHYFSMGQLLLSSSVKEMMKLH